FFPRGLVQKGLGTTQIPVADLADPAWAAAGQTMIDVGNVPLRRFDGNVAFASADGLETWFTLLNASGKFTDQRNLISNFTTFARGGRGIFTPYTSLTTFKNGAAPVIMNSRGGTAFARIDVTRDMFYDHVWATGWHIIIDGHLNCNAHID